MDPGIGPRHYLLPTVRVSMFGIASSLACFLLVSSPAAAIDYAQCEAMQKTYARLSLAAEQEGKRAASLVRANKYIEECGTGPGSLGQTPNRENTLAWVRCMQSQRGSKEERSAVASAETPYLARMEAIKKDYEKAGCP